MTRASVIDEKLDGLLAGRPPAPGDELAAELARLVQSFEHAFPTPVISEQVEDAHLASIMQAVAETPASVTAPLVVQRASLADRMRAGWSQRVAAATLALTTAFGGAAYAGMLPSPVQRAMADAASVVGLQIPSPDNDERSEAGGGSEDWDEESVGRGRPDEDPRRPGHATGLLVTGTDDHDGDDDDSDESRAGSDDRDGDNDGREGDHESDEADDDADERDGAESDDSDESDESDDVSGTDDDEVDGTPETDEPDGSSASDEEPSEEDLVEEPDDAESVPDSGFETDADGELSED